MKRITSRYNPIVRRIRSLAASRRAGSPEVLLDGMHLVTEALAANVPLSLLAIADSSAELPEVAALVARLAGTATEVMAMTDEVMAAVSPVRTPSGTVAVASAVEAPLASLFAGPAPLVLAGWGVQDPGNAGAIIRVADAAGASGVLFSEGSADPLGWKCLRGAMGSTFRVPVTSRVSAGDLLATTRAAGCRLVVLLPRGGASLFDADLEGPLCCLLGAEGAGLPETIVAAADLAITIPMRPPVESLNVSVTAALVGYEVYRRRQGRGLPVASGAAPRTRRT